jgi:S-adenosylmethionine/arginine decarboxylase-like enzyme
MNKSWGYHLILDCKGCDADAIRDPELLSKWIQDLVNEIDMVAHGQPLIVYNGEKPFHCGYTVVQIITTSSIVAHFIDNPPSVYLDVFSCKKFDSSVVKQSVTKYFQVKEYKEYFLTRQI